MGRNARIRAGAFGPRSGNASPQRGDRMKPPPFEYAAAAAVEEAVGLLAEHDGDAKIIAGGQSLVPMLNFRLLGPALLIDINRIAGLGAIEDTGGGLRSGALARHRVLETSRLVARRFPVLGAAIAQDAHLAIRNRGTIGGSLAHADPAAELPAMAVLLDARIEAEGPSGARSIAAGDFFVGPLSTALAEAELVTAIEFPALPPGTGWGFEEFARRSGDFAIAGAAATVTLAGGQVAEARIALMGLGDTPIRAGEAEAMLRNQRFDPDLVAAAAGAAREAVEPTDDLHASADFRRHLAGVLTGRAVAAAWRRAPGDAP